MNRLVITGLISTLFVGSAVDGQERLPQIVVSASPITLAQWTSKMTQKLERAMDYPIMVSGYAPSGIVAVRFICAADGRPAEVTLHRKSGTPVLDQAALHAIGRIKTMHPLPASLRTGQRYQANLLFASTPGELEKQVATIRRDIVRRSALFGPDKDVVMLDTIPRTKVRPVS